MVLGLCDWARLTSEVSMILDVPDGNERFTLWGA